MRGDTIRSSISSAISAVGWSEISTSVCRRPDGGILELWVGATSPVFIIVLDSVVGSFCGRDKVLVSVLSDNFVGSEIRVSMYGM